MTKNRSPWTEEPFYYDQLTGRPRWRPDNDSKLGSSQVPKQRSRSTLPSALPPKASSPSNRRRRQVSSALSQQHYRLPLQRQPRTFLTTHPSTTLGPLGTSSFGKTQRFPTLDSSAPTVGRYDVSIRPVVCSPSPPKWKEMAENQERVFTTFARHRIDPSSHLYMSQLRGWKAPNEPSASPPTLLRPEGNAVVQEGDDHETIAHRANRSHVSVHMRGGPGEMAHTAFARHTIDPSLHLYHAQLRGWQSPDLKKSPGAFLRPEGIDVIQVGERDRDSIDKKASAHTVVDMKTSLGEEGPLNTAFARSSVHPSSHELHSSLRNWPNHLRPMQPGWYYVGNFNIQDDPDKPAI